MKTVIGVATSVNIVASLYFFSEIANAIDTKTIEEAAACSSDQKKAMSDSLMNLATAAFGHFPSCHGAGGLAGHSP